MNFVEAAYLFPKQPRGSSGLWKIFFVFCVLLLLGRLCHAEGTNLAAVSTVPALPDASFSVLRVFGSLVLVVALFLGGVWLFRNWQRLAARQGKAPRLNVIESRSIGGRHSLLVVGYEQQRFLIATSPAGVQMISSLPEAQPAEVSEPGSGPSFAQAFQKVLAAKS
jgi:flagellar biogenesis protein FliO